MSIDGFAVLAVGLIAWYMSGIGAGVAVVSGARPYSRRDELVPARGHLNRRARFGVVLSGGMKFSLTHFSSEF